MTKMTLREFAESVGQVKAAACLGIKQSAISKAIRLQRRIIISINPDGSVEAEEIKPFPAQKQGFENAV
ncbi:Cro/CI family transcriptional regulator [Pseudescherichia sp.]|uniref:Cro/CI family transcriptional regulator n=1 Tax=Pseudescherichia sp. TaxID=2055881 RepID=UPI0028A140AD|nr:Cro/CI family transcriptional regulator [Pseudescherichia sp.]